VTGPAGPTASDATGGDLAIVLHSHMPYVEGFGTYPFGEEWLFDAVVRSYLPLLEFAERITFTVTPVLADQLEDPGVHERLRHFLVEHRLRAAEADLPEVPEECRDAVEAEIERFTETLSFLDDLSGDPLRAFQIAQHDGRIEVAASAATHAVLPLLASRGGLELQLDAGLRSHRRRFEWEGGFWLPECAYEPGLEWRLAEHGVEWFCVDQSDGEEELGALAPVATEAGPVAVPIDWDSISLAWSLGGYPSDPAHAQFAGKSLRGMRIWKVGEGAYDPRSAVEAAERQAAEFNRSVAERLTAYRERTGRRGLLVFAVDTELLGHWWLEGPVWLRAVLDGAGAAGVRALRMSDALAGHQPVTRALEPSSWGEAKDLRTWDSPEVADLAWAARRMELRLQRSLRGGLGRPAADRAARELLAVQASDWAFLDGRGQAGDYAYTRAVEHAEAMLEAIDSRSEPDPRLRNLAPDLSLAPLTEP
jgi:1,4-alpha-glucan branching enzyme